MAARQIGGELVPPTMCFYSKLEGSGGKCRTCLVKVTKGSEKDPRPMPKVVASCRTTVMDGMEATRRIRELELRTNTHIPIVAMTAHAMKGDRERCIESGMDNYVTKPFHKSDLYAVISQCASTNRQSN